MAKFRKRPASTGIGKANEVTITLTEKEFLDWAAKQLGLDSSQVVLLPGSNDGRLDATFRLSAPASLMVRAIQILGKDV